jgi:hypothetical protein
MYKIISFLCAIVLLPSAMRAQKSLQDFNTRDSIYFSQPYPYILPIWGDKAHKAEFRLPFPVGVMFNALVGTQNLTLSDMAIGFGSYNNPTEPNMIDLSDVVVFDEISAQTSTYNLRIDAWVLPFFNIYGIIGQTKKAEIDVNLLQPIPLNVNTEVSGTYVGFGMMAAGAIGPIFASLDVNRTFNYNPRLDQPAKVLIGGLRCGPIFRFNNNPDMNITVWTGAMYSHFNGETDGRIGALELAPNAPDKIDDLKTDLDNWYGELTPIKQELYKNIYNRLDSGLSDLRNNIENGYISYSFNKSIDNPWNMLIGAQWQINHRWQLRAEAQFLGDRTAGLFSLNYRFGIRGKNWFSK